MLIIILVLFQIGMKDVDLKDGLVLRGGGGGEGKNGDLKGGPIGRREEKCRSYRWCSWKK